MQSQPGQGRLEVGIELPVFEGRFAGGTARWADILAIAQAAEACGFDSLWLPDHLLYRDPRRSEETRGIWECWSLLAALAAATSRVTLGSLVLCASFRNPALTAKMADTVDEISGGRFVLGLGAGWHEPEYRAFGYPFKHRISRFAEAIHIIHGLLKHGFIDFEGAYYQARECELRPRGPRPGGPPILVGTTGERMLRLTARYPDAWNVFPSRTGNRVEVVPALQERVDAACREVGRDPATLERTAAVFIDLPGATAPPNLAAPPLTGTPEEIAEALHAYWQVGISHIQVVLEPCAVAGIEALAPALEWVKRE